MANRVHGHSAEVLLVFTGLVLGLPLLSCPARSVNEQSRELTSSEGYSERHLFTGLERRGQTTFYHADDLNVADAKLPIGR